ncbi:MAG: alanine dehydrogenase [Flavobacteriaceae bacterium]|nr:MAG: alanine dehydrogenase [Flavobacteriaceae bacterium]
MSIQTPFSREELVPKEEILLVSKKSGSLKIGIPKEENPLEKRICLTPDAVETLCLQGHQIQVETGAGEKSNFSDLQYAQAGAEIVSSHKKIFENPLVLKIAPLSLEEIDFCKPTTMVISEIQAYCCKKENLEAMLSKKITALAFEYIQDHHKQLPLVRLLGEITGTSAILIGAEIMSSTHGAGILMGSVAGLRPTEVVILGAGTVGEYATKAALGLGTSVRVFDKSVSRLRRLQNILGQKISTSIFDPKELKKALMRCDLAIGALRSEVRSPSLVDQEMIQNMKKGSVIVDVSINTGGCFETSEITTLTEPTFEKHGVTHYGVPNITSKYARTTSKALSNFFLQFLLDIQDEGGFETAFKTKTGLKHGIYLHKGKTTNYQIGKWHDLPYFNIDLLLT